MKEQVVYIDVDKLHENPRNARKNDNAVDTVAKSIKRYGFRNPLIVDGDYVVWCGNTRLKASRELGLTEVPCIIVNDLTPKQLEELAIVDNKSNVLLSSTEGCATINGGACASYN